jgi:hypothetical protein
VTGRSNASAAILQDLFDGATLTVNDKLFSDWTLVFVDVVDIGGGTAAPAFSQIEVEPLADDPLNPGLMFNVNGQLRAQGFDILLFQFGFRVSTLDGSARIKDNSLSIEASFSEPGAGANSKPIRWRVPACRLPRTILPRAKWEIL